MFKIKKAPQTALLNFRRGRDSPFRHFPDGKCYRAGPRGVRLCLRQNSHIAPGFESRRNAKQLALLHPKKLTLRKGG